jgi:hypothetical protein
VITFIIVCGLLLLLLALIVVRLVVDAQIRRYLREVNLWAGEDKG